MPHADAILNLRRNSNKREARAPYGGEPPPPEFPPFRRSLQLPYPFKIIVPSTRFFFVLLAELAFFWVLTKTRALERCRREKRKALSTCVEIFANGGWEYS